MTGLIGFGVSGLLVLPLEGVSGVLVSADEPLAGGVCVWVDASCAQALDHDATVVPKMETNINSAGDFFMGAFRSFLRDRNLAAVSQFRA